MMDYCNSLLERVHILLKDGDIAKFREIEN